MGEYRFTDYNGFRIEFTRGDDLFTDKVFKHATIFGYLEEKSKWKDFLELRIKLIKLMVSRRDAEFAENQKMIDDKIIMLQNDFLSGRLILIVVDARGIDVAVPHNHPLLPADNADLRE